MTRKKVKNLQRRLQSENLRLFEIKINILMLSINFITHSLFEFVCVLSLPLFLFFFMNREIIHLLVSVNPVNPVVQFLLLTLVDTKHSSPFNVCFMSYTSFRLFSTECCVYS